jgi:hypothetical protein
MKFEVFILQPDHQEEILNFERNRLQAARIDPIDQQLQEWSARWRQEALAHYLPMGWSFGARDVESQLVGYFLAQPILFFRGMTQSLWLDHLSYDHAAVGAKLIETAYRWSRDKHMQKVIVPELPQIEEHLKGLAGESVEERWWELRSTKVLP